MDIKEKIEEIVEKVKSNKDFAADFKADPVKAVEGVLGVDLPDGAADKIVDGVKAKIKGGEIADKVDDIGDKLGGFLKGLKK